MEYSTSATPSRMQWENQLQTCKEVSYLRSCVYVKGIHNNSTPADSVLRLTFHSFMAINNGLFTTRTCNKLGSLGITTRYSPDGLGFEPQYRHGTSYYPCPSRPTLRPTQPPVQWVPGLFPGVKRPGRGVDHPPPTSTVPALAGYGEILTCNQLDYYLRLYMVKNIHRFNKYVVTNVSTGTDDNHEIHEAQNVNRMRLD